MRDLGCDRIGIDMDNSTALNSLFAFEGFKTLSPN